ncbi:ATP-dependent DNA helicase DinG [Novimethylophilus kurashikiensis]|uniref:ATP-dependent DNA helicase DinG n=1 Tax=Novimethylophilus kurashikiensis TaxID=1825523 RepID=A0A2R5FCN6_9PROT|nr:helicase C-terminal domain-containing protein [Novimethylophilus kurashikiensis]GBG14404.1 ATP-dependent DNA helicase DinG [Novimethylophilus kurashikiensis]
MSALAKPEYSPVSMPLPTVAKIFHALQGVHGLSPRSSQLRLAEIVRSTLATGGICCVEAPTGTGKTLGYLAGALDQYAHAGEQFPVVVATATVGLQEQIIRDDIPRLAAIGAIDPNRVAIAKGRGRYFCPRNAQALEDKKMQDGQEDMFQPDKHVSDGGTVIALDMLKSWREKSWDGDQDTWEGELPKCWASSCAASSDTCVNRACEYFSNCPYMESRARLGKAQLIIANHDMVLADLAQRAEEQTTTALPPKKYALIFDEAHNLPEKAVNTKRATANISDTDWLRELESYSDRIYSLPTTAKAMKKGTEFPADIFTVGAATLLADMERWVKHITDSVKFSLSGDYSWGLKEPETDLLGGVRIMSGQAFSLLAALKTMSKVLADTAEEAVGHEKTFAVRMLGETHKYHRKAKELHNGLMLFFTGERLVRWVTRTKSNSLSLHTQPLEGREVLDQLLWPLEFPVAMVSATLQIAGSFDRFKNKCGLPGHAITEALPPVFDYSRGVLHQPKMDLMPGEEGFESELVEKIPRLYRANVAPGMLILFTSRESMRRVVRALPSEVRERCLTPDHMAIPELVALHKSRINNGERSILVGLDTMAEGLDLPGMYCGHVVITRLPFAVPGDPVEEARREYLGAAWFEQAYLADMLTSLIQATGRLIRRESDHGVITVLDKRLHGKKYSTTAISALPAFTKAASLQTYHDMVEARKLDKTHGQAAYLAAKQAAEKPVQHEKPAPVLKLVSDQPAAAITPAPVVQDVDPLKALIELAQQPSEMGWPVNDDSYSSVYDLIAAIMPPVKGPFADHDPAYLACDKPALGLDVPAHVWVDRMMPEAIVLGLLFSNQPFNTAALPWKQVLRLRPDVLQFAEILRSHLDGREDSRKALVSEEACVKHLKKSIVRLGDMNTEVLLAELEAIEAEAWDILSAGYKLPRKDLLNAMPDAAVQLALKWKKPSKVR